MAPQDEPATTDEGFVPLFDGSTLAGWHAAPRTFGSVWPGGPDLAGRADLAQADADARAYPARWEVVDGAIEGFQDPDHPGFGGYLVSDRTFGDFELRLEMRPDWPADTGVMLRRRRDTWHGLQVLVDHRKSGSIGGFFGNGLANFHAVPYVLDVSTGADGTPDGLVLEDPATTLEPMTPDKPARLVRRGDPEAFLAAWRFGDWNRLRVRCVGAKPRATTWVNDVLVAEIDLATLEAPNYDADAVAAFLGRSGHLALEVHDNDPRFGEARWARGARCRWRALEIKELSPGD
ncbi:3-keto-disaccharide hydrolase [Microlunatus flavus]|uniref:3-keto-alpha-glucoside-1,2-lyase/3-keto-2-hydroxy-glucal hydratase domain-containing protein n=1 Tax=Microlunatus flavus TaxID=1036181 RepID=A0A1H9KB86_9ACTN|nr:DUF1080 domain-containing protein [Microlunatus flavus]SEQ96153.1 protein of unknown function [Microlunatus flavus]